MTIRDLWPVLKDASAAWIADGIPRLGASIAFYATLSLAPLLLVIVAMAGLVFGRQAAEGRVMSEMRSAIGQEASDALQTMVDAADHQNSLVYGSMVGAVALLIGSLGLFFELQDALNTVWGVKSTSRAGIWDVFRSRLLSFALVVGVALLLLVSLIISAAVTAISGIVGESQGLLLSHVIRPIVTFGVIIVLFAMIYRLLPDTSVPWKDVWFGAVTTAVLFDAGKTVVALYLGSTAIQSFYGAAASFAALMLWNYYTAQIFLFGAELTKANANRRSLRRPSVTQRIAEPAIPRG